MTTRIYIVTVKADDDPTVGSLFPFLYIIDPEAIAQMEAENVYSIITEWDIDAFLDQNDSVVDYDYGEFSWDWNKKVWRLSGTDAWGNAWETDDYDADSEEQALLDAVQYLV